MSVINKVCDLYTNNAEVMELADMHGLEPCAVRRAGSSPVFGKL